MADFTKLEELLERQGQRFICRDLGWPKPGPERHVARIRHETTPALDDGELESLKSQIPEVPQLFEFYLRYGSLRLYCDTVFYEPWGGCSSAFYIAPPGEWEELRAYFGDWLADLSEEEEAECLPDWIGDCIVIGEVSNSGNYFIVPLKGPETGCVYEFEHDGFEFIRRAGSLEAFIASLCTVTDELVREIGGHTRYFDGKTDTQWLPERYEFD